MRVWRMRTGISITLKPAERRRLKALAGDRNTPHKHVWRAEIVLLSADGIGTNEIGFRCDRDRVRFWRFRNYPRWPSDGLRPIPAFSWACPWDTMWRRKRNHRRQCSGGSADPASTSRGGSVGFRQNEVGPVQVGP